MGWASRSDADANSTADQFPAQGPIDRLAAQADWQALQSHHPGVIAQAHTDHQNALTTANSTVTYLNDSAESTRVQYLAERAHTVTVYYTYSSVPSLPDALQAIANLYDNPAYVVAPPTGYAPPLVVVTALPQRLEAADAAPADLLADIHGEHYNPTLSGAYEQALAAMFGGAAGNRGPASAAVDVVAQHLDDALRILYPQGGNLAVLGAQAGADWGVELFDGDGPILEGFTRHLLNGRVFAGDKLAAMLPPEAYVFPKDYVSPEDESSSWWTPPVEWLDMMYGFNSGLTFGLWEYVHDYQPHDNEWYEAGVQRGEAVWKIAGGLEEMAVGSVLLSGGSAGTATGFLAEIGIPVGLVGLGDTLHGLDTFWAGLVQMGTGERQRTFTSRLIEVSTPLTEDQCEVVESVAFCIVNVYYIGNLGRQVARQLPRSASRVSRAADVAESVPAPARNSADALPAARKAAQEQAVDAAQTARKVTDDATELPAASKGVRALDDLADTWCFAPRTLVATSRGRRAIRDIEPGEKVFAFDHVAGRYVLADVLQRHDNSFSGDWVSFSTSQETIELTANHPIWVVEGERLAHRPTPQHLDVPDDEGKSLAGRWVNSQDLREGDVVLSRSRGNSVVRQVVIRAVADQPVCNLSIRDHHTFLVGADEILAHNESWCDILETKFGWTKPRALLDIVEKEGLNNSWIHGHHIVMKRGGGQVGDAARKILIEYDIPLLGTKDALRAAAPDQLHNLSMAINRGHRKIHGPEYAQAVLTRLQRVVDEGQSAGASKAKITASLKSELAAMRELLEEGKVFW